MKIKVTQEHIDKGAAARRLRNLRLAALIENWLGDSSRDDERIGPLLDQLLADHPIRFGNAGDQVRGWRRRCHARMAAMNEAEERRLLATLNEPRIPAAECFRKPALDAMSDATFARLTLTEAEDLCGFASGEPDEGGLYHLRYVNELRRRLLRREGEQHLRGEPVKAS